MDLTAQIEAAAQTADPNERRAKLRILREEAEAQLGTIDTHLADVDYEREAAVHEFTAKEAAARHNATLREELIRRGISDEASMDDAGLLSHADLDALSEEGLLEHALDVLFPVTEGAGGKVFGTMIHFQEKLHPRGRGGKFAKKPGGGGPEPKAAKRAPNVPGNGGGKTKAQSRATPAPAASASHARREAEAARAKEFKPVVPEDVPQRPKGQSEENKAKVANLAARIGKRIAGAAAGRQSSPENTIFNAKGSVSQHTLLQYVRDAASEPDTMQLHSRMGQDGRPVFTAERKALHEAIIDMALRAPRFRPDPQKPDKKLLEFDPNGAFLEPDPDGQPKTLFSGGGYAAGKGASLARLGDDEKPRNAILLDPDRIKALLPEFHDGLDSDDPEANLHVYREAWEIAQEVQRRAQAKKLNMVVDGISDTTVEEIDSRVQSFLDHGYKVHMVYTDIPTEEAISRAAGRAAGAKADSDRRHIPDTIMRAVHRDVAATIPALMEHMQSKPEGTARPRIEVYDNHQGQADDGSFNPPKRMALFDPETGQFNVEDDALWQRLQAKGDEKIPGLDAPERPAQPAPVSEAAEPPQEGAPAVQPDAPTPTPADEPPAPTPGPKTTDEIVQAGLRVDVPYELPASQPLKYEEGEPAAETPPVNASEMADRASDALERSGMTNDPDSSAATGLFQYDAHDEADAVNQAPKDDSQPEAKTPANPAPVNTPKPPSPTGGTQG
jgi:hypothetical protein